MPSLPPSPRPARYFPKAFTAVSGREISGKIGENSSLDPYLILSNKCVFKGKPSLFFGPILLNIRQIRLVQTKLTLFSRTLASGNQTLVSPLPDKGDMEVWRKDPTRMPIFFHREIRRSGEPMTVITFFPPTNSGSAAKRTFQSRSMGIFQEEVEPMIGFLDEFLAIMGVWPGSCADLKIPDVPPGEANQPAVPPIPLDPDEPEDPREEILQPAQEILEYAECLEEDSDSPFEDLREELDEISEYYAKSEEDGWYYPDEEEAADLT